MIKYKNSHRYFLIAHEDIRGMNVIYHADGYIEISPILKSGAIDTIFFKEEDQADAYSLINSIEEALQHHDQKNRVHDNMLSKLLDVLNNGIKTRPVSMPINAVGGDHE